MLWVLIRSTLNASNEYPQNMFLWTSAENDPIIITKYFILTMPLFFLQILIELNRSDKRSVTGWSRHPQWMSQYINKQYKNMKQFKSYLSYPVSKEMVWFVVKKFSVFLLNILFSVFWTRNKCSEIV